MTNKKEVLHYKDSLTKRNKKQMREVLDLSRASRTKEMFELRKQGFTYEEIGNQVDLSKGQVYKIMKKYRETVHSDVRMSVIEEQQFLVNELMNDLVDLNLNIERASKLSDYDENGNHLPLLNVSLYEQKRKHIESMAKLLMLDQRAEKELDNMDNNGIMKLVNLFATDTKVDSKDNDNSNDTGSPTINISNRVINRIKEKTGFDSKKGLNEQIAAVYEYEKSKES